MVNLKMISFLAIYAHVPKVRRCEGIMLKHFALLLLLVVGHSSSFTNLGLVSSSFIRRSTKPALQFTLTETETLQEVWSTRRELIRSTLENAEKLQNVRTKFLNDDLADSKLTVGLTAGVVAIATVTLRLGGRAALVSGLGLDMFQNSETSDSITSFLAYTHSLPLLALPLIYLVGWIITKVTMIDAFGIVLAFSSGVLFNNIWLGGVLSAFFATIGSTVAFSLARLDTPVRAKVLSLYEDNAALRGIERAIEEDGIKSVLTLRLAPVVPIPIGAYNYIYGLTKLPYNEFITGIFLGSLKVSRENSKHGNRNCN